MINVIIPTYKARDTLPNALDSLVAQTKKMFLVTIVQDCDDEDYTDIIDEYKRRGLKIALLTTPHNGGPGCARQYGIDNGPQCDFITFLDADDMLTPEAIFTFDFFINASNADIVMTDMYAERPNEPSAYFPAETTPVQWCGGKVYRTSYLKEKNIRFLDELRLNEDSYFNLVAFNATERHQKIAKHTYFWRCNPNSLTRSVDNNSFFRKSWDQYVASQIYGLKKLYEIGKVEDPLLGATLINIYTTVMRAERLEEDLTKIDKYVEVIREIKVLWEQVTKREVWAYIHQALKPCEITPDAIHFYRINFFDWITQLKGESL